MSYPNREILFEFQQIGAYVKVTAIDTVTLTEVSVSGPAKATQAELQQLAMRRLQYVLNKKQKETQSGKGGIWA